jgi:hypothetical protein
MPIYGIQTVVSLYVARRLHLNPLGVVLGSQISIPPIAPLLFMAAIATGHLLLHGSWFFNWMLGSVIVGAALATITFLISQQILVHLRRRTKAPSTNEVQDRNFA